MALTNNCKTLFCIRILLFTIFLSPAFSFGQYCASNATNSADSEIDRVQLVGNTVTINQASISTCATYTNYTAVAPADLTIGNSYTVNITQGTCGGNYTRYTNAWIDWNNDNDFADAGEMLGTGTTGNATASFITAINFTVPGAAVIGNHRMRCIVTETASANNPCAVYTYGETEDYTVTVAAAGPMTYSNSTVTQTSTATTSNCEVEVQIVRLEVAVTGSTSPLSLTNIQTNYTGTAPVAGVSASRIYYTGNSAAFSNSNLFGSGTPSASAYNISGSQALAIGTNYFWLVYDLTTAATVGQNVDAAITQFTLGGTNYTPSVTAPAGSRTITACPASGTGPGGVTTGLQTWLRADAGTTGVASMTAWTNQVPTGTATNLNGNPALNQTTTAYNYNYVVDFSGPVGTLNGGIAANRQCILLNGFTGVNGIDYRSLFFAFQLNDLTRLNTHVATVRGVTLSSPANGTWHGDANGAVASILLEAYDITDFGTGSAANTWQRNQTNILSNSVHTSTKHILSAVCQTGGSSTLNAFLGGQDDLNPSTSFAGHVRDWRGPVGEIIGFTSQLNATERRRVDSYLAIKYGITLPNNYLATDASNIFVVASPYNNNIIGIGRDDLESLVQKQSHHDDDNTRIYMGGLAAMNASNGSTFSNDRSYVMIGDNNGAYCATTASNSEIPTGLASCDLYSRLEREWKVTRTNMAQNYNMDVKLAACGAPGSVNVNDLRLLVDDDGNFANGGTQCYFIGDGTGIGFTYSNPTISVTNINTTHVPNNSTRYITIASINQATPLPVTLLEFNAVLNDNNRMVDVYWSTQTEQNCKNFEVQKLTNGNWETIDIVDGHGTSTIIHHYATIDEHPVTGPNYYRLKQNDLDGNAVYSEIRVVNLEIGAELLMFPNPANNAVQLVQKGISEKKVLILDEFGRKVSFDTILTSNDTLEFNTSAAASGVYFIQVENDPNILKLVIKH